MSKGFLGRFMSVQWWRSSSVLSDGKHHTNNTSLGTYWTEAKTGVNSVIRESPGVIHVWYSTKKISYCTCSSLLQHRRRSFRNKHRPYIVPVIVYNRKLIPQQALDPRFPPIIERKEQGVGASDIQRVKMPLLRKQHCPWWLISLLFQPTQRIFLAVPPKRL